MEKENIGWQLTDSSTVGNDFINDNTELFKSGKWAFLARELIQNSNDALSENQTKLIMKMSLDDMPSKDFPDRTTLLQDINGTLSIDKLPERCKKFCENAKTLLESDVIRVLKISDYNTDGVTGSENSNNEISSAWNALIYDEGNSQKRSETSTGSFGTGKNAPFALSGINSVFYVTKDKYNQFAVEGVAKLFTSYVDGKKKDKKIYYAKNINDALRPLNREDCINKLNKLFYRDEVGSDVIIFGVDFDQNQMRSEIIQSVVENFFVLISEDKLEIDVFGEKISKESLWTIVDKYCDRPIEYTNSNIKYGYIKQYLSVYTNIYETRTFIENVPGAGNLKLVISKGNDLKGKWVAMFRNNGMKIFDNNIRTAQQNYSAIFFPGDSDVDKFLRKIENPTHDFFDPETRIDDKTEKRQAIARYDQIIRWIRNKIEDYTKIDVTENDYLEGMEEYIQLDDSDTENKDVGLPEVEIVSYDNKTSIANPMINSDTSVGTEKSSDFKSNDGKSKNKKKFKGQSTENPGEDKKGLIKDYHNNFKVRPKITSTHNELKIAFSLENYNSDTFNIEVDSVGEDNSVSDNIPNIVEAIDINSGNKLIIQGNKIMDVPVSSTNLIEMKFNKDFSARYKIEIYKLRGEDNES